MTLRLPALDPRDLAPLTGSGYPDPYRDRVLPRERRALGDALGLSKIGVNLATLAPGKESSMRHWHTHEEEFIFVVAGELVLRTDQGEQTLMAGQCAGFKAGHADGHQLINRTEATALYLAISNRDELDRVFYPDVDLLYNPPSAPGCFARRDGTPY
ncbi:MAG TPA: cupin domain-containing protein [Steroidobacteraceae bacterium]|nr:cupin domain-containing protein [Steroidobacteraceae bacterium]